MQLVLIGGAQRSGTTLLQTLLANALDAPLLPESHILCDLLTAYRRAKRDWHKTHYFYSEPDDLLGFFRAVASRHLDDLAKNVNSAPILVLKDPNLIQVMEEAREVLPGCKRIVCVRDPRDIAASFLQIGLRQAEENRPTRYRKRDVRFISKKIVGSYEPLLPPRETNGVVLARYETVAVDPKAALAALSRDTGLTLREDRVDHPEWLEAKARHDPAWITELEGQAPSPASIGSFKTILQPEEIEIVQELCGPLMQQFDYELVAIEKPPPPPPRTPSRRLGARLHRLWKRLRSSPESEKPASRGKTDQTQAAS